MIKILLAEDHNIVRNGIKSLLEKEKDIHVVDEASNGEEVLEKIDKGLAADLIITDLNMPEVNGLTMLENLSKVPSGKKILVLSMMDHENYVMEALRHGAKGYLLKSSSKEELVFAVRQIASGNFYICSELVSKLVFKLQTLQTRSNIPEVKPDLSKRELEVLHLIAQGYTNHEIAEKLFTSRRTVEGHRQNLLEKAGVKNTATLIRYAMRTGLID